MHVFELTKTLIDIPSVTLAEEQMGNYLRDHLSRLCVTYGAPGEARCEVMEVESQRFNVFASFGEPIVTLSTHMDTVPPFIPAHEDAEIIWGRGACDTKGTIACMLVAAERLLLDGVRNFGLLFVVGEEINSIGARHASLNPRGSKFIINGEPTNNHLALACKGGLRYELIATGKTAHSGYPESGESAIEKLLDALKAIRAIQLPIDPILGPGTLNIGTIRGGRRPDLIADEAHAQVFVRLVCDSASTRHLVREAVGDKVRLIDYPEIPAVHLRAIGDLPTTVVGYTTDIPAFNAVWGQPLLLGPGTIHVAHTLHEHVRKQELLDAIGIYERLVRQLQSSCDAGPSSQKLTN